MKCKRVPQPLASFVLRSPSQWKFDVTTGFGMGQTRVGGPYDWSGGRRRAKLQAYEY
jgi:hypothetical protein